MKVICNSVGKCSLCKDCGAAVPHDHDSCEPCPVLPSAKCAEVVFEDLPLNFVDDSRFENGNYSNYCLFCTEDFKGMKQRRVCARCAVQFNFYTLRSNNLIDIDAAQTSIM